MIVNGVTLPDIPAEVLAEYPYAIVFHLSTGYMAYLNKEPYCYVSTDKTGIAMNFLFAASAYRYCALDSANDESWDFNDSVNDGPQVTARDVVWSNHDIYYATAFDQTSMTATVGTEIYFSSSVHPERVSIGRSLVDGFATQVQRLTGTTDQMNAVQIREKLSEVKAGIKIGDTVLPAIPEDLLAEYPYAVILGVCVKSGDNQYYQYALRVSTSVFAYLDKGVLTDDYSEYEVIGSMTNGKMGTYADTSGSWGIDTTETDAGSMICPLGEMQLTNVVSANYTLIWANHDIYEITSLNSSTGEYTTGDLYFSECQNFNGVWLPKIPEDVLAEYPYAMVLKCETNNLGTVYRLFVAKNFIAYLIPELFGSEYVASMASGGYRLRMEGMGIWGAWNEFAEGEATIPIGESNLDYDDFTKVTVVWANHDIDVITSLDLTTGEYTTGGLYFPPLPAIDTDRVSMGYDLCDGIVEEVQRLSGESGQMNALRAYWKLTTVV